VRLDEMDAAMVARENIDDGDCAVDTLAEDDALSAVKLVAAELDAFAGGAHRASSAPAQRA
jgi:hypothetical protein